VTVIHVRTGTVGGGGAEFGRRGRTRRRRRKGLLDFSQHKPLYVRGKT